MNLETIEFIKNNVDWREQLKAAPYFLHINEDNNYAILKYDQIESDFTLDIVKECRGLIVDLHTLEPVALSFKKFFNVQEELADEINWEDARVQEKVDGSKILIWYNIYTNAWQGSTSSTLDMYQAKVSDFGFSFGDVFDKALASNKLTKSGPYGFESRLDKNYCYTFELVSPETRIVVPYTKANIYLTGVRRLDTFEEVNPDEHTIRSRIKRPKEYKLSNLHDCLKATEHMGYDQEGFVVVDNSWNRVKIKSPAYVAAHYLKNNGVNSRSRILSIIEKGEQSEFLGYFPEYKEQFEDIESKYNGFIDKVCKAILDFTLIREEDPAFISQKEQASFINSLYKDISGFLFKYAKVDLIKYFVMNEWKALSKEKKMNYLGFTIEEEKTDN